MNSLQGMQPDTMSVVAKERNVHITISHIAVKRELKSLYKSNDSLLPIGFKMETNRFLSVRLNFLSVNLHLLCFNLVIQMRFSH